MEMTKGIWRQCRIQTSWPHTGQSPFRIANRTGCWRRSGRNANELVVPDGSPRNGEAGTGVCVTAPSKGGWEKAGTRQFAGRELARQPVNARLSLVERSASRFHALIRW